ncbi:condensation protein [Streptomyces sp. NPDC093707]|uniref:condensation protein n=1 Tax=Streptomyces sp. NPDC093707 TaxID=3154984 RepID=UPI00344FA88A
MTALQPARHDPPEGGDSRSPDGLPPERIPPKRPSPEGRSPDGRPSGELSPDGRDAPTASRQRPLPRTCTTSPRIPFPLVDEISRHCLEDDEPETVHVEVHLPGRLDHERLRTAFHQALARHPRVLMRQIPVRWWHRQYTWQLTPAPDVDPVVFPPPGPDALARARVRALTDCPPLDASPPLRLEVIDPPHAAPDDRPESPPRGTVLLLTIHHTALDGPAGLRILATAAELYGGTHTSPPPPPTPTTAPTPPAPHHVSHPDRTNHLPLARPARIAPTRPLPHQHTTGPPSEQPQQDTSTGSGNGDGDGDGDGTTQGNGLLLTDLPVPTRPPHPTSTRPPYTVNDQLLVATYLMTTRWNALHNRPTAPVVITMPIDDRPRGPQMPVGNGTRLTPVHFPPTTAPTTPGAQTVSRLLHHTATHTQALKSAPGPQLAWPASLLTALPLPIGPRRALTRALRTLAAPWTPTTLLSNIGRIPYPLDFGPAAGRATAVWFSAPARMPRGLSVTTAATSDGDRIHLALRWSRTLLDDAAAARLLDLFRSSLAATAWPLSEGAAAPAAGDTP